MRSIITFSRVSEIDEIKPYQSSYTGNRNNHEHDDYVYGTLNLNRHPRFKCSNSKRCKDSPSKNSDTE